jgi:hypothetical protein
VKALDFGAERIHPLDEARGAEDSEVDVREGLALEP